MASSFEKSVKGATKIKLAAPKSKYVEHILVATHAGEAGVAEVFRALQNRLRDSTWTIVFKSLIVVHLMIREGEPEVTLKYLSSSPSRKLAINNFTEVQTQGHNIRAYSEYLLQRAVAYGSTKIDYVRNGEGRLKRLTIDKGLLRETESVQEQVRALLKCDFLSAEPENEITLTAFRLLTMDLLALFHVMNEGTINVLEHYFEMSHPDAERALNIYKNFAKQTDQVVQYLSVARHFEHATRLEIPRIKHAPTGLAASLEEYLNDKDFEINRRQYLAQQEAKKRGKSLNGTSKPINDAKPAPSKAGPAQSFPSPKASQAAPVKQETKGPAPDLIDFFDSIEQNQQPMAQPQYQQPLQHTAQAGLPPQSTGFVPQNTGLQQRSFNPFDQQQQLQPIQPNFTGAGFGGYTPQPQQSYVSQQPTLSSIPQDGVASFPQQPQQQSSGAPNGQIQPQSTNPFRQSVAPNATGTSTSSFGNLPTNTTGTTISSFGNPPTSNSTPRSATNPFTKSAPTQQTPILSESLFATGLPPPTTQPSAFSQPSQHEPIQPLQPMQTGTNPFARNRSSPPQQQTQSPISPLMPNVTGSTNPFRQSAFVNQQTGQGWQGSQGTMGGLEQLETMPVFPRPGQSNQQPQGWPA